MRLLLISSSYIYGGNYLDHCIDEFASSLADVREVLFCPYALRDYDRYTSLVRKRMEKIGVTVTSLHSSVDLLPMIERFQAIFVGGGNTFRLLRELYERDLLAPITRRVKEGALYIGSSAGANIACPTIKTTNDMPIVFPSSFQGLSLVPFNINPHFVDTEAGTRHMGESREARILEFLEENQVPVLGMREGAFLRVEGKRSWLSGTEGARLFINGSPSRELESGASLEFLFPAGVGA
jgi:dipeptidase E